MVTITGDPFVFLDKAVILVLAFWGMLRISRMLG